MNRLKIGIPFNGDLQFSHFREFIWGYSGLGPTWELLHNARFTLAHPLDDHFNFNSGIDMIIFAGIITIYLISGECSTPGGARVSISRVSESCYIQIFRIDVFLNVSMKGRDLSLLYGRYYDLSDVRRKLHSWWCP